MGEGASSYCPRCGLKASSPSDHYCGGCGRKLVAPVSMLSREQQEGTTQVAAASSSAAVAAVTTIPSSLTSRSKDLTTTTTSSHWLSTSRGVFLFAVSSAIIMLGANLLHAYIHEILGHGLLGVLAGQQLQGFYISPLGASYTFITVSSDPLTAVLQYLAGTIVSVLFGAILFFAAYPWMKRRGSSFGLRLSFLIFIIMLESDLLYGFMSPLVGFGDIFGAASLISISPPSLLSIVFLPLALIFYYPVLREYFELLAPFAGATEMKRLLCDHRARLLFLLKVIFAPIFFVLLFEFLGLTVLSSSNEGLFFVMGIVVMVLPLAPAAYLVSRFYDQTQRAGNVHEVTGAEAKGALVGLWKYAIAWVLFMAASELAFGPTPAYGVPLLQS